MKIALITSGLAPGKDGVGDYTRTLAVECQCAGHAATALALNDVFVHGEEEVETGALPILRLGRAMPWRQRIERAGRHLDVFNPDWISLQFVCYGFHPKGLVHGLAEKLVPLLQGRKLHIMFHELWIGDHTRAGMKETLIGWAQRTLILQLVRKLRPSAISTSNGTYIAMLKAHGITAHPLALFGSIPIVERPDCNWLFTHATGACLAMTPENRSDFWVFGLFAALYPGWPAEPLFKVLREAAVERGKRVIIASIGRIGVGGERIWEDLVHTYSGHLGFLRLREQPTQRVSAYFQWIDAGLAASPWNLIGKSASVAAMLEHGLPVLANRDDWHARCPNVGKPTSDPQVHPLDEHLGAKLRRGLEKRAPATQSRSIAARFIAGLEATSA